MDNPYAVPLEDLDAVHVAGEELVAEQSSPLRWAAGGALVHPFGDGANAGGGGADGE
jgi:hypothetical protein